MRGVRSHPEDVRRCLEVAIRWQEMCGDRSHRGDRRKLRGRASVAPSQVDDDDAERLQEGHHAGGVPDRHEVAPGGLSLAKTSSAHDHPLPEQLIEGTLKQRIKSEERRVGKEGRSRWSPY